MFLLKRAELMREGRDVGILAVRRGLRVVGGEGTKHLSRKSRRKGGKRFGRRCQGEEDEQEEEIEERRIRSEVAPSW
jgi:hypothetical protein